MGFLITLPSGSSSDYFPNNTLSHYTTYLPKEIELDSQYEVALMEIQYTNNFYNIPVNQNIHISFKRGQDRITQTGTVNLPRGYYSSIEDVLTIIRANVKRFLGDQRKRLFNISSSSIDRRVTIEIEQNNIDLKINFEKVLERILGLSPKSYSTRETATSPYDLLSGLHAMYIYSDVITRQIVGDSFVPLMRVVPIHGNRDQHIRESFQQLQYIPVNLRNFRTIELDIRNEYGNQLPVHSGEVVAVLHFRKKLLH